MRWIILTGLLLAADLFGAIALASEARARSGLPGVEQRPPSAHASGEPSLDLGERQAAMRAPDESGISASSRARAAAGGTRASGIASIYGGMYGGARTASGERLRRGGLTAAHRTLPFGTRVQVTNRSNGRSVVVRINDRGPFIRGRVIDVTPAAARVLGFSGLTKVSLSVVGRN